MTQYSCSWAFTLEKGKHVHTKTWTLIFIAALLIITTSWKQPICVSVDEWLNIVYLYNGMLLSVGGRKWECSAGGCHYKVRAWGSFFVMVGGNNGTVLFPDWGDYTNVLKLIEMYTHKNLFYYMLITFIFNAGDLKSLYFHF